MKILLIDNNDSFTGNLEHLIAGACETPPTVMSHRDVHSVRPDVWDLLVLSPGPGAPEDYPGYARLIDSGTPVLGVCMGMQILNVHFGGSVGRLAGCVHGMTDEVLFAGAQRTVARYHSLYCSSIGVGLRVEATNRDGVPMVLVHEARPLLGYQFHPESFLTPDGEFFIRHALRLFNLA